MGEEDNERWEVGDGRGEGGDLWETKSRQLGGYEYNLHDGRRHSGPGARVIGGEESDWRET
jgi:hypothetical protein